MPYDVVRKNFVEKLEILYHQCQFALQQKQDHAQNKPSAEQFTMDGARVDVETGGMNPFPRSLSRNRRGNLQNKLR